MLKEWKRMWQARNWMKKNQSFLPTWHAYVGYSLDLFNKFEKGSNPINISEQYDLDLGTLKCWIDVGLSVGHLKQSRSGKVKPTKKMLLYFTQDSSYSIGELLKEMMELHIPTLLTYPKLLKGEEKNIFHNDVHGRTVASTSSLLEKAALPKVYKWIKEHKSHSVLDIGCGAGGYLIYLANKLNGIEGIGIDISKDVIEDARRRIKSKGIKRLSFYNKNINTWSGPNRKVDLVMMNNLLYYYPKEAREKLFQRICKFLAPGGSVAIVTPLHGQGSGNGKEFSSAFNSFMYAHENLHSIPTKEQIEEYADNTGLKVKSIKSIIPDGSWYFVGLEKT